MLCHDSADCDWFVCADLLGVLMSGAQAHLDSPIPEVRRLCMVVAEAITDRLNVTEHKLKFEVGSRGSGGARGERRNKESARGLTADSC